MRIIDRSPGGPIVPTYLRPASAWADTGSFRPAFNVIPNRTIATGRPSRRRLRRDVHRWMPLGNGTLVGRITMLTHGGSDRPVITRGSKHSRFRFTSTKMKITQLGEGPGEEFLAKHNEVLTQVAEYICHPCEMELMAAGRLQRYRPDALRAFRDGSIEMIEVKRTEADHADPSLRETLAAVRDLLYASDIGFRVKYLDEIIGTTSRQRNVDALFMRRSMALTRSEERIAGRLAGRGEPIRWRELRDLLSPADPLHGDAVIERLLAGGMLETDLDVLLTPNTMLLPMRPFSGPSLIGLA